MIVVSESAASSYEPAAKRSLPVASWFASHSSVTLSFGGCILAARDRHSYRSKLERFSGVRIVERKVALKERCEDLGSMKSMEVFFGKTRNGKVSRCGIEAQQIF